MYSTWGKNSIIFMFDIAIILFKSCKQSLFQVITHNNVGYATITAMMVVLTLPPCLAQAQDMSRNYVRTVTMLDAGGTDDLMPYM